MRLRNLPVPGQCVVANDLDQSTRVLVCSIHRDTYLRGSLALSQRWALNLKWAVRVSHASTSHIPTYAGCSEGKVALSSVGWETERSDVDNVPGLPLG